MSSLSRRRFLQASSLTAGAALVTATTFAGSAHAAPAAAASAATGLSTADVDGLTTSEPIMLFVSDAAHGDVTVLSGGNEVVYHDPTLVARVQRAISRANI
jgi:nitrous oxide reductase